MEELSGLRLEENPQRNSRTCTASVQNHVNDSNCHNKNFESFGDQKKLRSYLKPLSPKERVFAKKMYESLYKNSQMSVYREV